MFKKINLPLVVSLLIIVLAACAPTSTAPQGTIAAPAGNQPGQQIDASAEESKTATTPSLSQTSSSETSASAPSASNLTYPIVDTGQGQCYDNHTSITCPTEGTDFYGQDAQYTGYAPSYTDNGDGTITDNVTGLRWQQSPDTDGDGDIDAADKFTYTEAGDYCDALTLAGYDDWRLPDIKSLYSLIDFRGTDPILESTSNSGLVPFIDTTYFAFAYGDTSAGERVIDAQFASSTLYVSTTMNGAKTMFGVNFADGRIKGYGFSMPGGREEKTFFVLCTRGNTAYGINNFTDNGDGTITDKATGLMWSQNDSGQGFNWADALAWVEQKNAENYLGYSDWRLPNAKELESIVDYTRSPDTTDSAAIDPVFNVTGITNVAGQSDYPFYWSGTTHIRADGSATSAAYIAFGRGLGSMNGETVIDVHGAGCQRSDPKDGDPAAYPTWGHGPQGDLQRVYNYVRLVRGGEVTLNPDVNPTATRAGIAVESTGGTQKQGPPDRQPPTDGPQSPPEGQPSANGQQDNGGQGQQIPPEAIEACSNLSEGAACTFESPYGQVSGTCTLAQQQLACVPEGSPGSGPPSGP